MLGRGGHDGKNAAVVVLLWVGQAGMQTNNFRYLKDMTTCQRVFLKLGTTHPTSNQFGLVSKCSLCSELQGEDDFPQGCHQNSFSEKLGLLAQPADPPPPRKLGRQKKKKKFNVYFAFQAILSILFVHEKFHFSGWDDEWGSNNHMN